MNNDMTSDYDVIPVVRELSADALTPLAAFAALSPNGTEAFLFESVERGENVGRYSFVGFDPRRSLRFERDTEDPVGLLNEELRPLRVKDEDKLPPFFGGAVGYFGYGGRQCNEARAIYNDVNLADAMSWQSVQGADYATEMKVLADQFNQAHHATSAQSEDTAPQPSTRMRMRH